MKNNIIYVNFCNKHKKSSSELTKIQLFILKVKSLFLRKKNINQSTANHSTKKYIL